MLKRFLSVLTTLCLVSFAFGSEFVGIFLQGQRIGYMHTVVSTTPDGKTSSHVTTQIGARVLGQGMSMRIVSQSVRKGLTLETQKVSIESAGRIQRIEATYAPKEVTVKHNFDGKDETKVLAIPEGALILDDPTIGLLGKGVPEKGTKVVFYVLDPMTISLVANEAEYLGVQPYSGNGVQGEGPKIKVVDPRATTEVWLDKEGELAYATGPMGIGMRPITRAEAVGSENYMPDVDLAAASKIVPDKPITDPATIAKLKLKLTGPIPSRLRSDYAQTVTKQADGSTIVEIHPARPPFASDTIAEARTKMPEWAKNGHNLSIDDPAIQKAAEEALAGEKLAIPAAEKISNYVYRLMRPNASIGVLRDAREVLRTKEGVCRDYATLAASLMRAAGLPTKLVTGAVYSVDGFYYHAWVEVYSGSRWVAFDPTMGGGVADATHIKFAEGEVDTAFITFTLDGCKIEVLDIERK